MIVHLDTDTTPEDTALHALTLVQNWLAQDHPTGTRLALITHGALATHPNEPVPALTQSTAWGLIRTAQSEHPGHFTLIDTDNTPASHHALPTALTTNEPQLALRQGHILTPRLTKTTPTTNPTTLNPNGTVLITGATGALGKLIAEHLITHHHITHLHLTSRRGPQAPDAPQLLTHLTNLGATVTLTACDTTDRNALHHLLTTMPHQHPLTAVIHAAGILHDTTLETLTPHTLNHVLHPKTQAAHHLHELTQHHNLDAFILFSSIAGIIGNPGQANYAAANTYLDALAQHRHAQGLPATSIAWGLWEQPHGMAATLTTTDLARLARTGITPLTTTEALTHFDT
ncbi:beta-ketoacyl reductase, partial [Kitasatospora sp. NPDC059747]|uniref:beta-ketoacyl reductase n=1 Tax=Kitasatospora sp. NPDC059747 TaxID=3346930 RepID=UPI003646A435